MEIRLRRVQSSVKNQAPLSPILDNTHRHDEFNDYYVSRIVFIQRCAASFE